MPFLADAVANEFLSLGKSAAIGLTPMKLQKLVFFAHGWHLALKDVSLIRENVQAWKFGPVVVTLYHEFKEFGNSPIDRPAREIKLLPRTAGDSRVRFKFTDPQITSEEEGGQFAKDLVAKVWDMYKQYTPAQLSNMTHAEGTPWYLVAKEFNFAPPKGIAIPDELIRDYFKSLLGGTVGGDAK